MPPTKLTTPIAVGFVVAMSLLAVERTRCRAQPPTVASTDPSERPENPLAAEYRSCDADNDGLLTEAEYLNRVGQKSPIRLREFKVFDHDGDGRMNLAEFLTVAVGQPEDQRGTIPDPVILLVEASLKELTSHWGEWDQDGDALLALKEFENAAIGKRVRGLELTAFRDWDLDRDQKVSREDAARLLEIAFGVRTPEGGLLRSKAGRVVDWRLFRRLKADREGFVNRDVYLKALGPLADAEKQQWLASTDKNGDGRFNYAEFATSNHRTDPVATFLHLDADLNGRLTPEELETLSADQLPVAKRLFPGFDDDDDGALSLREYQLTPLVNLLASWESAQDTDSDGKLELVEFRFHSGVALEGLSAEYFRRLDVNEDQSLSLDEFPFVTSHRPPIEIYVQLAGGKIMTITIPDYPIICSPEISPDGRWVAVDGWKHGQSNVTAHLLVASLEQDEVRDLGIGCIPHWSADGRRIAYSKYGRGVFLRDFEGDAEEESIDPQGWAIHFSTDGLKTAYVKGGGNLVIHDVATDEKRFIFPDGNSPYRYIEHNFTWSPDSQRICFKGHRPNGAIDVGIVSVTGGDPKLRVRCDGKDVQSDLAWLADGNRVMFPKLPPAGQHSQIFEIDPDGDKPAVRYPTQPKDRNNGGLCWSRDGKTFVYMSTK
ncbi:MAG: hypothetical protein AABP62_09135 [Planctomycetota bacterium]